MKVPALFQGQIITILRKYIFYEIKKSSSPEQLSHFNKIWHPWEKGVQDSSNEGPIPFQGEIIMKLWKKIDKFKKSSSPEPLSQFQPNLVQGIFGLRGIKFVQLKGSVLFQGQIIMK